MREYGVPMRASSLAITRSAHSARSLPPPSTHPCTLGTHGLWRRHRLMKRGTAPWLWMWRSRSPCGGPSARRGELRVPVVEALAEVKARAERPAGPAQHDHPHPLIGARRRHAASISSGIGGTIVFRCSGRLSVMLATPSLHW